MDKDTDIDTDVDTDTASLAESETLRPCPYVWWFAKLALAS